MIPELQQRIIEAIKPMQGWCWPEKAIALADLILTERPKVVVEIGVFGGRSLVPQAMAMQTIGGGMVYGIDPWKKEIAIEGVNDKANDDWWLNLDLHHIHRLCMEAIWQHNLDDACVLIRSPSQNCVHLFPVIDVLHLDGNHSEFSSCRDVCLFLPRVKPGGFVWFDDSDWPTTQKALKMVEAQCDFMASIGACRLFKKRG